MFTFSNYDFILNTGKRDQIVNHKAEYDLFYGAGGAGDDYDEEDEDEGDFM